MLDAISLTWKTVPDPRKTSGLELVAVDDRTGRHVAEIVSRGTSAGQAHWSAKVYPRGAEALAWGRYDTMNQAKAAVFEWYGTAPQKGGDIPEEVARLERALAQRAVEDLETQDQLYAALSSDREDWTWEELLDDVRGLRKRADGDVSLRTTLQSEVQDAQQLKRAVAEALSLGNNEVYTYQGMTDFLKKLIVRHQDRVQLLAALQWSGPLSQSRLPTCPTCQDIEVNGHRADCDLAKRLAFDYEVSAPAVDPSSSDKRVGFVHGLLLGMVYLLSEIKQGAIQERWPSLTLLSAACLQHAGVQVAEALAHAPQLVGRMRREGMLP